MNSFVSSHPFPTYDEALRLIRAYGDPDMSVAMYVEYGKPHHEALKRAFESGMDRKVIRQAGEIIHSLGGMQAMQMNYYAFSVIAPFRTSHDPDIQYAYKELEYGWEGVGQWQS